MNKYLVEFTGTLFLVLVIGLSTNDPQIWAAGGTPFAPIAIGSVLMCMVYMGGPTSGAHYNPAVTFALMLRKKISSNEGLFYMLFQLAGAVTASLIYYFVFKRTMSGPAPMPGFEMDLKPMLLETLFTFALVSVVFHVAVSKRATGNSYYGLAIGFIVMAGAFTAGPVSGGAFNPAVGLGPSLVDTALSGKALGHVWIYLAGPLLGAFLASLFYGITHGEEA